MAIESTQVHIHDRLLPLQGASNVRDLGGYPTIDGRHTRWGALLRADGTHALTADDRAILQHYDIGLVVDLRMEQELQRAPSVYSGAAFVSYRHIPLQRDGDSASRTTDGAAAPQSLDAYYRHIVDECQASLRAVFDVLTAPQALPALFGCTAGKDRTGIVAALALSVAGVRRDVIIEDYALTAIHGAALLRRLRAEGAAYAERMGQPADWFDRMLLCEPQFIANLLAYLDARYGSPEHFLQAIGVRAEQQARLRANLVTSANER